MIRHRGAHRAAVLILGLALAATLPERAFGAFSGAAMNPVSSFAAATLSPPTQLQVSFTCVLLGFFKPVANLTWTATSSSAPGYKLERWHGAALEQTTTINGTGTTAYSDGLALINLNVNSSYTWYLRTFLGSWVSTAAVVTASTPIICP